MMWIDWFLFLINVTFIMRIDRKTINEIFRFCITGGLATLLQLAIYWLMVKKTSPYVALPVSYVISFIFNYIMSARFTFRQKTSSRNGIGFAIAHVINFTLQMAFVNLFVLLGVAESMALIPTLCITIPTNFTIVRFVFKKA